jgi:hypothetical protein
MDFASKFAVFSAVSVACFDIVRDLLLFVVIFGNIDIERDFFSTLEKFAVFFEAGMGSSSMLAIWAAAIFGMRWDFSRKFATFATFAGFSYIERNCSLTTSVVFFDMGRDLFLFVMFAVSFGLGEFFSLIIVMFAVSFGLRLDFYLVSVFVLFGIERDPSLIFVMFAVLFDMVEVFCLIMKFAVFFCFGLNLLVFVAMETWGRDGCIVIFLVFKVTQVDSRYLDIFLP